MLGKTVIIGAAAVAVAFLSIAAQATAPFGNVTSSSNALVVRDGHLLAAAAKMPLFVGDRVMTRANGAAKLALAGKCKVAIGASAMVSVGPAACAGNNVVNFDGARAGVPVDGMAFAPSFGAFATKAALIAAPATAAAIVGGCIALRGCGNGHDDFVPPAPTPASP